MAKKLKMQDASGRRFFAVTCEPCNEEKRSLSLFATERSEDYAAILGTASIMIVTMIVK